MDAIKFNKINLQLKKIKYFQLQMVFKLENVNRKLQKKNWFH